MSLPYPSSAFSATLFPLHPEEVNFQFRPDHLAFTPFSAFSLLSTQSSTLSRTIQTSTDENNNNVHYSNKRKEFEARSEKKVETNKFSCPICGFNGLIDLSSLRHHFQEELALFLQTDPSYAKRRKENPANQELHIDVESITTDTDELVTSSSCSPPSPSVSTFSTSIYNSKFPSEYNRSKGERWEVCMRYSEIHVELK